MKKIPSPLEALDTLIRWLDSTPERRIGLVYAGYFPLAVLFVNMLLYPISTYEERNRYLYVIATACLQLPGVNPLNTEMSQEQTDIWVEECMDRLTSDKAAEN